MQRFNPFTHNLVTLTLSLALAASSPIFAHCDEIETYSSSGDATIALAAFQTRTVHLDIDQPGILGFEVVAPLAATGSIWIDPVAEHCSEASSIAFQTLHRSASRLVLGIVESGTLAVRMAYSPERDRAPVEVTLLHHLLPTNAERDPQVLLKDGEGGDGGDGDGDGSEEANREIPPTPAPTGDDDGGTADDGTGDGDGSEEANREIPPIVPSSDGQRITHSIPAVEALCHAARGSRFAESTLCADELAPVGMATGFLDPDRGDHRDHFAITLEQPSRVAIGLAARAELRLLVTDEGNGILVARTLETSIGEETVHLLLPAGRYDIRIEAKDPVTTSYGIVVESTPLR